MLLGRVLKTRNWWDSVDENIILGAYPFAADVPSLAQAGVKAVVNTCHEYQGPVEAYEKYKISQLHIPTTDFTHPSPADVNLAVSFINEHVQQDHRVYVHCKAGRARSATVVACWLIQRYDISADQAQQRMLDARPHVNRRISHRPVVLAFEKTHTQAKVK